MKKLINLLLALGTTIFVYSTVLGQVSPRQDSTFKALQKLEFPKNIPPSITLLVERHNLNDESFQIVKGYLDTLQQLDQHYHIQARAYLGLANLKVQKRSFKEALNYLVTVLEFAQEKGDKSDPWLKVFGLIHRLNSNIYYHESNFDKSLEEADLSISYYLQAGDSLSYSYMLSATAMNLGKTGETAKGIEYAEKALPILEKKKRPAFVLWTKYLIATLKRKEGHLNEAKNLYLAILPKMKASKNVDYNLALTSLGDIEYLLGNSESAIQYINESLSIYDNTYTNKIKAYDILSNIYETRGNYRKALENSKLVKIYADSAFQQNIEDKTKEIQTEIAQLTEKQTIKDLEYQQSITASKHRMNMIVLIAIFLLLLGSLLFWFYKRSIQQKQSLLVAAKEAEVQKVREKLLTSITHELRTPLTLITGQLELIKSRQNNSSNQSSFLSVQRNAKDLLNQVNQLLDWNRLEAKALRLNPSVGDITQVVHSIVVNSQQLSVSKQLIWKVQFEPEIISAELDFQKLETILKNLVTNAIKYTPLSGSIEIIGQARNGQLSIQVKDSGIGIPQDQIEHIFDWYNRAQQDTNADSQGFGISLALSKELAQLMGGDIEIQSTENVGSTFTLTLPYQATTIPLQQQNVIAKEPLDNQLVVLAKENVQHLLLIEDHNELANFIAQVLSNYFNVQTMPNAQQGIAWALENQPDIIITDLMLPDKDGFYVCKTLKENTLTEHIPIVILTARNDHEAKLKGFQVQADAFLTKPFKSDELRQILISILQNRRRLKIHYNRQLVDSEEKTSPYVDRLIKVIEANYSDSKFNVDAFARQLQMSRSQLFLKTKSLLGISPSQMIKQYRMEKARKLLQNGTLRISEVAYQCGYASHAYFSTVYKNHFNINPTEEKKEKTKHD